MTSSHLSEDIVERYTMGNMSEPEMESVEDHLMVCQICQDEVQKSEEFLKAFRRAAERLQASPPTAWDRVRSIIALHPGPVLTGAMGLVAIVVMFALIPMGSRSMQRVDLNTVRGTETSAPHVKSNSPIDLQIDVGELPSSSLYTIELVDASGRIIGNYTNEPKSSKLSIPVTERLPPGQYWVRIYGNSLKTELLREYGLKVD